MSSSISTLLTRNLHHVFGEKGVSTFVPAYVGTVAAAEGLPAQRYAALVGLVQNIGALIGFATFGFLADTFGRKPTTILYYVMCLILTPLVYLGIKDIDLLVLAFAAYGFFIQGTFAWTPIWLPELFPTRMRATAAGFIFNAPRLISAIAPLIAGTIIVGLGGYGKAATIIGMFYVLGLLAVPFLPETRGKPLPDGDTLAVEEGRELKPRTS
jgi:MFS family permease